MSEHVALGSFEMWFRLVAGILLILLNGFFVAIEFALTRARQYPEEEFKEEGLELAWEMTQELEIYLTSCQVGITASSIAVGIVAEPALAILFEPLFEQTFLASVGTASLLAFAVINLLHLTHGEQTPTYLGVERSKTVCRWGAAPLYYFNLLLSPLIRVGDWIAKGTLKLFGVEMTGAWLETGQEAIESRAKLRQKLGSLLDQGKLSEERREEIINAFRIGRQPISEHMISRDDVVALSTQMSTEENLGRMEQEPHTRFPLLGSDWSDFRGIVYFPVFAMHREDLARGEVDFDALAAPPMTLAASTSVSDAIDQFQTESQELALVLEDGDIVGMITVTDALEAVMGDIEDPLEKGAV